MAAKQELELDRLIEAAQSEPSVLTERIKGDPEFRRRVEARVTHYTAMDRVDRLRGCYLSRRGFDTLRTVIAALNTPGVQGNV